MKLKIVGHPLQLQTHSRKRQLVQYIEQPQRKCCKMSPATAMRRLKSIDIKTLKVEATEEEIQSCIEDDRLLLACGKTLPIVSNAYIQPFSDHKKEMPVVCGRIGENLVRTLRDTGCSGVVVKREFVSEKQLTGKVGYMLLIDNTLRKVPVAKIRVDTPYRRVKSKHNVYLMQSMTSSLEMYKELEPQVIQIPCGRKHVQ